MLEYMWALWLGIFVLSIVIEASTVELVSVFFSFGSLVALIISLIPGVPWWVQLIVFVVVSGATLFGLRPLMNKILKKEKRNTNVDELIGKKVTVIDVNNDGYPEVKVNGLIWRISSIDENEHLVAGDKAIILRIEGNRLMVRKDG